MSFGGSTRLALLKHEAREKLYLPEFNNDANADSFARPQKLNPKVSPAQLKIYKEALHAKYTGCE